MSLFFIILYSLFVILFGDSWDNTFTYNAWLDTDTQTFRMFWTILNDTHIDIGIIAETLGWFAIGISPNGQMPNSDIMFARIDDNSVILEDRYVGIDRITPGLDTLDGLELIMGDKNGTHSRVRFIRSLVPCDTDHDMPFSEGTTRLIWAYGDAPFLPHKSTGFEGSKSLKVLAGEEFQVPLPANYSTFDIIQNNVTIPKKTTSYYCTFYELPVLPDAKRHIIKFEPIISYNNRKYVHHMVVYSCSANSFNTGLLGQDGECTGFNDGCSVQVMAWAVGAPGFVFPENVGLPFSGITSDPLRIQYVRIEMHYDNPNMDEGVIDASGVRVFWVDSDALRDEDAFLFEIGLHIGSYQFIPPGIPNALNTAICGSACMDSGFSTPVTVFGAFLHAHTLGTALSLRHIRGSQEIEPIISDFTYDFDYQQVTPIDPAKGVKLQAGDQLILDCYYDSTNAADITFGGTSTGEEMCQAYIYVYPQPNIVRCESDWTNTQIQTWGAQAINYQYLNDLGNSQFSWNQGICALDWYNQFWTGEAAAYNTRNQACPLAQNGQLTVTEPVFTPYQRPNITCTGQGSGEYSNQLLPAAFDLDYINNFDYSVCLHNGGNGVIPTESPTQSPIVGDLCSNGAFGTNVETPTGLNGVDIKIGIQIDCDLSLVNITFEIPSNNWVGIVFGDGMTSTLGNPSVIVSSGKDNMDTVECALYLLTTKFDSGVNKVTSSITTPVNIVNNGRRTIVCSQPLSDTNGLFSVNTTEVKYGIAWSLTTLQLEYHSSRIVPYVVDLINSNNQSPTSSPTNIPTDSPVIPDETIDLCSNNVFGTNIQNPPGITGIDIKIGIKVDCILSLVNITFEMPSNTWVGIVFGTGMAIPSGFPALIVSSGKTGSNPIECQEYSLTSRDPNGVNTITNTYTTVLNTVNNGRRSIICSQSLSDTDVFSLDTSEIQYGVAWSQNGNSLQLSNHFSNRIVPFKVDLASGITSVVKETQPFIHGILMFLGWGLCAYIGIFSSANRHVFKDKAKWWFLHRLFQSLTLVFCILGYILVIVWKLTRDRKPFDLINDPHQGMGFAVIIIGILQPFNALFRGTHDDMLNRTQKRIIWEYLHKGLGYIVLLLSQIVIILGLVKVAATELMIVFIIYMVLFIIAFIVFKYRGMKQQKETIDSKDAVPDGENENGRTTNANETGAEMGDLR